MKFTVLIVHGIFVSIIMIISAVIYLLMQFTAVNTILIIILVIIIVIHNHVRVPWPVQEDVESRGTRRQHTSPPPAIVLHKHNQRHLNKQNETLYNSRHVDLPRCRAGSNWALWWSPRRWWPESRKPAAGSRRRSSTGPSRWMTWWRRAPRSSRRTAARRPAGSSALGSSTYTGTHQQCFCRRRGRNSSWNCNNNRDNYL